MNCPRTRQVRTSNAGARDAPPDALLEDTEVVTPVLASALNISLMPG